MTSEWQSFRCRSSDEIPNRQQRQNSSSTERESAENANAPLAKWGYSRENDVYPVQQGLSSRLYWLVATRRRMTYDLYVLPTSLGSPMSTVRGVHPFRWRLSMHGTSTTSGIRLNKNDQNWAPSRRCRSQSSLSAGRSHGLGFGLLFQISNWNRRMHFKYIRTLFLCLFMIPGRLRWGSVTGTVQDLPKYYDDGIEKTERCFGACKGTYAVGAQPPNYTTFATQKVRLRLKYAAYVVVRRETIDELHYTMMDVVSRPRFAPTNVTRIEPPDTFGGLT